jgi:ppGpp synthetase/RelA/SpoT-type nucleotidyltranferase
MNFIQPNKIQPNKIDAGTDEEFSKMAWTEPKHSKKKVSEAGTILLNPLITEDQYSEALLIVNNWRSSHAYPLNNLQGLLRSKVKNIDEDSLVSQRLKRVPSILNKLKRFPSMQLHRMQDIGGCRAILSDINKVYQLKEALITSGTKNELIRLDNYIENPKDSGYRGIHLIYKYCGKKDSIYNRHLIEVQVRSQIQHAWATTVEIIGAFLKQSLKAGEGSSEWLEFFKLVSILFSQLEVNEQEHLSSLEIDEVKNKVIDFIQKLYVYDKLRAFSVSTDYIEHHNTKSGYFLLVLDVDRGQVSVKDYLRKNLNNATSEYLRLEKKHRGNSSVDVVLVAAESIKSLRKAYPNYFADSRFFSEILNQVLDT